MKGSSRLSFKTALVSPRIPWTGMFCLYSFGLYESFQCTMSIPEGRECYTLLFFYEDNFCGAHALDPIPENVLMVFPPHVPLYYGREKNYWTHTHMAVSGRAAEKIIKEKLPLGIPLSVESPRAIEDTVIELQEKTLGGLRPIDEASSMQIFLEMVKNIRIKDASASQPVPYKLRETRDYIFQHYRKPISVTDLARQCNFSNSYFTTQFKSLFGVTPKELLIELRMEEAKRNLLEKSRPNIIKIAKAVGYTDAYHFSKLFHKHIGMSPTSYHRRQSIVSDQV